jgi:hypothetical protein
MKPTRITKPDTIEDLRECCDESGGEWTFGAALWELGNLQKAVLFANAAGGGAEWIIAELDELISRLRDLRKRVRVAISKPAASTRTRS